jgi:hypothetical protein
MPLSPELSVMLAPAATYARLAEATLRRDGLIVALRRPAFVALLVGTAVTMSATRRVSGSTLVSVTLCWMFATIVQAIAAGAMLVASPDRRVSAARAIDLIFMGHGPWSVWLLVFAALPAIVPNPGVLPSIAMATAPLPAVWTAIILFAFCRTVLQLTPRVALTKTFLHQAMIWIFTAAYISATAQVWPRVLGAFGR